MVFEVFQKLRVLIYASQLTALQIIPLFCTLEFAKCGKEEKKLQKFEYLKNKKSFFDEIKSIFHSF